MNFVITAAAFIVALGVLIVIHEYGHYLVARLCGVRVLRFSIGFGRPLWRVRLGADRTEWVLAALPLGGYVKMLDEHEGPVDPAEVHRAFKRQPVWRRVAIVVAGPVANFLLAIAIYWALFVVGVQEARPVVAAPDPGTLAAASGLQRGETLVKINDEDIASWQQARWRLLQLAVSRASIRLEVTDASGHLNLRNLDLSGFDLEGFESDPLARMGLRLQRPDVAPVVGKVIAGSVAETAGLRAGDRVVSIDGQAVGAWDRVVSTVQAHAGVALRFRVLRDGRESELVIEPRAERQGGVLVGRIGAAPEFDADALKGMVTTVRYAPATALALAAQRTWETSVFSLKMLGKMLIGEISWKNLSGPVTIADYAGQTAQLGLGAYVAFLALISISLGVLNLLPIPLLDGGHLLYYLIEVLKGSPVSMRVMEIGQRVGLAVLLSLMVFAFYNDINRLLAG